MNTRVAVVTGANRGLGLEIVRQLAARDLRVVLASRSVERGEAAAAGLGDVADRVTVAPLDVADTTSVTDFVHWLHRHFRRCDVLVNNAAVAIDGGQDASTANLDVVRRTLETNLLGAWLLTQAVVPAMRARRYGRIVNLSSSVGRLTTMVSGIPAYRVSKTALNALTRIFADELAPDGILVNACCPGWVRTDMGGPAATVPVAEASDTPTWLATLPPDGPTGGLYRDRRLLAW
ncbi:SDR family oxidoreductase [Plantactinospora mayteni]|uniref:Short-chain dehydrogenase n=1 Tax=Plantactinospora mayteni TaxID=566021 RepID=A0ABQ4EID0_9ACTN|nr:SDR family oxidoreductase [Plantactinospora mayteni]GIG94470.1 short-chain dehydrogenase [Plantactinospora mayteni]